MERLRKRRRGGGGAKYAKALKRVGETNTSEEE